MKYNLVFIFNILTMCVINNACRSENLSSSSYKLTKSKIVIKFAEHSNQYCLDIIRDTVIIQTIFLDPMFKSGQLKKNINGFTIEENNSVLLRVEVKDDRADFTRIRFFREFKPKNLDDFTRDCLSLNIGQINWFGGPENRFQYWPIEKASFSDYSYYSKESDNCAIAERFWFNSRGVFVYVEDETPLFLDQNSNNHPDLLCFTAKQFDPFNIGNEKFIFAYQLGIAKDARKAYLNAVETVLGKPSAYPDELMVRYPIWSTWAKYKTNIDEEIVLNLANEINNNKFPNSQFEIDDDWEECYGALTFNKQKFPDIKRLTDQLKEKNFRVTLWIHPFINKNCDKWYNEAKERNFLVLDHNGNPDTNWWNSGPNEAAYIDFTNPEAQKWFLDRLYRLQNEDGIDSFKFDAGEASWSPKNAVFNYGNLTYDANIITKEYIRTVAKLGPIVEVRSGQGTQDLPIFLRMIDKDSEWGWNNGLQTLVTTLLQLNMVGYPFVLPDMIGGNGYNNHPPNAEMFIRWLQANVFMPSLQFSYLPWDYENDTITEICLAFTNLHAQYADNIIKLFKKASTTGEPVNPPLWWIDPADQTALQISDQFLLGEEIISAPILKPDEFKRDIYLPKGSWKDGNTDEVHQGPKWLMEYPAPINVLPYFIRN